MDVRYIANSFSMCQNEKRDHTLSKGQLQGPKLPVQMWKEASMDFVLDLLEF